MIGYVGRLVDGVSLLQKIGVVRWNLWGRVDIFWGCPAFNDISLTLLSTSYSVSHISWLTNMFECFETFFDAIGLKVS